MEIIRKNVNIKLSSKKFTYKDNICFFDIETTGFSRKYNYVYLIGILYYKNKSWKSKQFWLNNKDKEKELLYHSISFLNSFDHIINYNGDSFDISFLNERCKYHNLNVRVKTQLSYDIYSILRKNKEFLNLSNLKLETVEESINIYRKDQLSGKECIDNYKNYLINGHSCDKKKILLHNYEDLIYLMKILKIIDRLEDKKTILIQNKLKFIISTIQIFNNTISINGLNQNYSGIDIEIYSESYYLSVNKNSFKLNFSFLQGLTNSNSIAKYIDARKYFNYNSSYLLKEYKSFNLPLPIYIIYCNKKIVLTNIKLLIKSLLINNLNI